MKDKKEENITRTKVVNRKEMKEKHALRSKVANALMVERWIQKMSQQELADAVGTQKSSISRIEKGEQNITLDYVELLAEAMGKEICVLMESPKLEYGDISTYCLKLYDQNLLKFTLSRDTELKANITDVNDNLRHLFPIDLELSEEGLINWIQKRTAPQGRHMIGSVLKALGLHISDLKGILDVSMSLSLNDSYWIPRIDFEKSFSEVNLFQNRFDHVLSFIAYVGYGDKKDRYGTTPELTTNGMLRKCWNYSDGRGIWLYKSGTIEFANAGNEPYCEVYASQIAERMGLNHVKYELENYHGFLSSKCKLFTDIDTSYVPIGRVVKAGGIQACLDFYKELGDSFYQELASMLVFDAVIINEDRHYGNFGLLRDNHTGEFIAPAPIFDNGISLLCYGMYSDLADNLNDYVAERTNPYGQGNQFIELAKRVMGPRQKEELRRLLGFKFKENTISDLPGWRLKILENLIQDRIRELLS